MLGFNLVLFAYLCLSIQDVLTLIGQLLLNFGIHLSNASLTSLVGASNPALTALFAWLLIQEALQARQIVGILLVTLGVAALGIEQIRR